MTEYIPKSTLVAEIEKLKGKVSDNSSYCNVWQHALRMLELSLDSHEVKEVDLEKEIDKVWDTDYEDFGISVDDFYRVTRYFFELGLKAQKGKEVDLEKDVRQILSLYYEGIKYYDDIIKKEREENGASDLAIKIMDGVVDARELGIQYVIDKLKAQKGESYESK